MPNFIRRAILTCKVGQTGLVFGMLSGFRSVHARLQVSVRSSCDLFHLG